MQLPSPEQQIFHPLFEEKGISCWMKRDDLIHPFVSGNKWRKLKPILELAKDNTCETLVSYGGAWSNHLIALAAASAQLGIKSRGFVRGELVNNPLLSLCKQFGMELEFVSRESFRQLREENTQLVWKDQELWIPEGANCDEGRRGMRSLWQELEQAYDVVMDSIGSGTSIRGLQLSKPKDTRLVGIMAVKDQSLAKRIEEEGVEVFSEFSRGGFAKMDEALFEVCRAFSSKNGILLDPVYTGKQWMALLELLRRDHFIPGQRILFIHSGGLAGWMSNPEQR